MTWSTREIAEITGTSVKAVRYYHEIGLLPEPDRAPNGYKKYEIGHLTRLLHIKRLSDLGVPLAQVDEVTRDGSHASVFRAVDAELARTVERLQAVQSELSALSLPGATPEVPTEFGAVAPRLRENDRALLSICAQLYSVESMTAVRELLEAAPNDELDEAFRDLPEDADEQRRQALAERIALALVTGPERSVVWQPKATTPRQAAAARRVVGHAVEALFNRAQIDVLRRAREIDAAGP
ncbi:MerR family transcriptional regulator [Pseudonocardia sp. HH130629-09]|uniref:MerR family transcriptional regulator n=1 Tax=Pseudonocardia sp. HH130629-09 TaxID=1641402 RepID=UPI0006CB7D40|nr:MerR family transcriptional regulator [Pseudonocardia sp. HH130629-09]ALE84077.1 hypothetical protein XF36_13795 [Pseudonocardia sp. HH130629-09]